VVPIYWPPDIWGTTTSSRQPAMPTSAPDCPGGDSAFYEAVNGKWFILSCNTDYFGGDLTVSYGTTYTQCLDSCAQYPNCQGVAWAPTQEGSPCYLKSDVNGNAMSNHNIWGAIAITPPLEFPPNFETEITSTMTAWPPGATLETLANGPSYTECTVLTTTDSRGHSTVVPVIVPLTGPPLIVSLFLKASARVHCIRIANPSCLQCWGCISIFPIKIVIKLPNICIVVFGIKIGLCGVSGEINETSGGGGGGGGSGDPKSTPTPGEDGDPTDPNDGKPSDNPSSPSSQSTSSATSSTCTVSVTATYESVFCSVTTSLADSAAAQDVGAYRRRQDQPTGCSTIAYSTVSGCSAVGTTTTTTATETPSVYYCSPDTCGSDPDSCSEARIKRIERDTAAPPDRVRQPPYGTWADPSVSPALFLHLFWTICGENSNFLSSQDYDGKVDHFIRGGESSRRL
jgi:hypothetical protein